MLSLGMGEILLVAAVAVLVVGPERLPRVLRTLGRWYGQARRAADDLRRAFVLEADRQDASERYAKLQARRRAAEEARREHQTEATEATDDNPDADRAASAPPAAGGEPDIELNLDEPPDPDPDPGRDAFAEDGAPPVPGELP